MKKWFSVLLIFAALLQVAPVKADEGMWLPLMIKRLNQRDLQEMGLQLTPEEIYSVNNSSLKDAIVSLGGFCTGEIISDQGLMLTNHHCAYDAIRTHSSVENDYLTNGFWAMSRDQELPNRGLTASFVVRMDDVTERVLAAVNNEMSESEREAAVSAVMREIEKEASEGNHYRARVRDFFRGNEYYLFLYEVFQDVRLVGAPPESIGKYGGDTDNWMWPRHTGDFALMRVYSGPDGKPAPYSEDNVPLKPRHHLPVSLDGVEEGDFAMVMGFPGSTDRYLTSFGIRQALDIKNPTVVDIRDLKLKLMKEDMDADEAVRIKYASKYAQTANYWKYFIGQSRGLKRLNVYEKKKELEAEFARWVNADRARQQQYGNTLQTIEEGYKMMEDYVKGNTYILEAGVLSADAILFAFRFSRLFQAYDAAEDETAREALKQQLVSLGESHFEEYSYDTDLKLFSRMLGKYYMDVSKEQHPEFFSFVSKKFKGDFDRYGKTAFSKSIFTDKDRYLAFLEKPNAKSLEKDLIAQASGDLMGMYFGMNERNAEANAKLERGYREFIAGLREMKPDKQFFPDANSTLRISLGSVGAYNAADAVFYEFYTTLEGVMEKEDPTNPEFIVPEKLKELHRNRDYGRYADSEGRMIVNFISNNDITGGNSGSPVINGKGELIGCAFDGNWEAMSGDIAFEHELQRTISVDARYILFIIDKFAGAAHLVDEMTVVKNTRPARAVREGAELRQPAE
ncbi:MAG: S46 family peptidase [Cryomorphaceae bacterium]|nr:MAG: S46 family peptidase [Cryomorphaceae bacterium]